MYVQNSGEMLSTSHESTSEGTNVELGKPSHEFVCPNTSAVLPIEPVGGVAEQGFSPVPAYAKIVSNSEAVVSSPFPSVTGTVISNVDKLSQQNVPSRSFDLSVVPAANSGASNANMGIERDADFTPPPTFSIDSMQVDSPPGEMGTPHLVIDPKKSISGQIPALLEAYGRKPPVDMSKYRLDRVIGEGGYGVVYIGTEIATNETVAIKKFKITTDNDASTITTLREVEALLALKHVNVIQLKDVSMTAPTEYQPSSAESPTVEEIYCVLEFAHGDLRGMITLRDFDRMSPMYIQCYMHQLLCGVEYMHARNFVHRDLKPANLLMTRENVLKIADFGMVRRWTKGAPLTHRVVTLRYRAPELILNESLSEPSLDMWSVGVIFLEMWTKRPLTMANSESQAIQDIWAVCGAPTPDSWPAVKDLPFYAAFKPLRNFTRSLRTRFGKLLPPLALDLLDKLLVLDPKQRLTAHQALQHPYFTTPTIPHPPSVRTAPWMDEAEAARKTPEGSMLPTVDPKCLREVPHPSFHESVVAKMNNEKNAFETEYKPAPPASLLPPAPKAPPTRLLTAEALDRATSTVAGGAGRKRTSASLDTDEEASPNSRLAGNAHGDASSDSDSSDVSDYGSGGEAGSGAKRQKTGEDASSASSAPVASTLLSSAAAKSLRILGNSGLGIGLGGIGLGSIRKIGK